MAKGKEVPTEQAQVTEGDAGNLAAEDKEAAFIAEKRTVETLKVYLNQADFVETSKEMARVFSEQAGLQDELIAIKSQFKSQLDAKQARINELSTLINTGYAYRKVDCLETKNYRDNMVTIIRLDSGETVRTRIMGAEERQRGMDFGEGPGEMHFE